MSQFNASTAIEYISSEKYRCLSTSSHEVHSNLWSIFFGPLLLMNSEERAVALSTLNNHDITKSFIFSISQNDTIGVSPFSQDDINKQKQFRVCFYFLFYLYH